VARRAHIFIDNLAIALKAFPWLSPALLCGGPSAGQIAVAASMATSLNIHARFFTAGAQAEFPHMRAVIQDN